MRTEKSSPSKQAHELGHLWCHAHGFEPHMRVCGGPLCHAVQAVVKGLLQPTPEVMAKVASGIVSGADQAAFMLMLTDALRQLHEGSIARYRLRRSEYAAWQARRAAGEQA